MTKDYYEEGVEKGIQQGMIRGEAKGVLNTLISLAKKGLLSIKDAAEQCKMSEEEFKKLLTT